MKKILTILIILIAFLLLINSNAFSASEILNTETISSDSSSLKCNIYIIFPKQLYKLGCSIFINGLLETVLKHKTYVSCTVSPGKTKIASFGQTYTEMMIDTVPGKDYYIKIKLRLTHGINTLLFCDFIPIDEIEGKQLLSQYNIVDWNKVEN